MWLHLDLEGIDFRFCISKYRKSNQNIWDDQWCKVDLSLQSGTWLNYQISSEILLSCEVEELYDKLHGLFSNKLQSSEELEFIEPDLSFILNPQKKLPTDSIIDIDVELRVHLWNDGLTANYISLYFDRKDIEEFYDYLRLVITQACSDDISAVKSSDKDIIYH